MRGPIHSLKRLAKHPNNWWYKLSEEDQKKLEKGLQEVKTQNIHHHYKARNRYAQWL